MRSPKAWKTDVSVTPHGHMGGAGHKKAEARKLDAALLSCNSHDNKPNCRGCGSY